MAKASLYKVVVRIEPYMRFGEKIVNQNLEGQRSHGYTSFPSGYYFAATNHTKYQGYHVHTPSGFEKVIDSLSFTEGPKKIIREGQRLTYVFEDNKVTLRIENGAIHIEATNPVTIQVDLDNRLIDQRPTWGRTYEVKQNEDATKITYTHQDRQRELRVLNAAFEPLENWVEKQYEYDERRGDHESLYVYRAGNIHVQRNATITLPQGCVEEENHPLSEWETPTGICAGHPWFYQPWSRDEVISVEPLIRRGYHARAAEALRKYLEPHHAAKEDGSLASADAVGWLAKRYHQLFNERPKNPVFDAPRVYSFFKEIVERSNVPKLVHNKALETWMDTQGSTDDTRSGVRVEIQFGYLAILRLLHVLGEHLDKPTLGSTYSAYKKRVRDALLNDDILIDGVGDDTVRPNVFLAWYLARQALHKEEWEATFDSVLRSCWQDWGGLSSISKNHALYKGTHTGVDNESYHRGDSWYYVNNIAAIALWKTNRQRYLKYVEKIRSASLEDYFYLGAIGACSEISSAEQQESFGCFSQAWSYSTLDELLAKTLVEA